jgi:hypothetical protein
LPSQLHEKVAIFGSKIKKRESGDERQPDGSIVRCNPRFVALSVNLAYTFFVRDEDAAIFRRVSGGGGGTFLRFAASNLRRAGRDTQSRALDFFELNLS